MRFRLGLAAAAVAATLLVADTAQAFGRRRQRCCCVGQVCQPASYYGGCQPGGFYSAGYGQTLHRTGYAYEDFAGLVIVLDFGQAGLSTATLMPGAEATLPMPHTGQRIRLTVADLGANTTDGLPVFIWTPGGMAQIGVWDGSSNAIKLNKATKNALQLVPETSR